MRSKAITAMRSGRSASAPQDGFGDVGMFGLNVSNIVTQATR
jgi:hypothetical protein